MIYNIPVSVSETKAGISLFLLPSCYPIKPEANVRMFFYGRHVLCKKNNMFYSILFAVPDDNEPMREWAKNYS
jgi:hypothetical protein